MIPQQGGRGPARQRPAAPAEKTQRRAERYTGCGIIATTVVGTVILLSILAAISAMLWLDILVR